MTDKIISIMQEDIARCEAAQTTAQDSQRLYEALISKYDSYFDGFSKKHSKKRENGSGEYAI